MMKLKQLPQNILVDCISKDFLNGAELANLTNLFSVPKFFQHITANHFFWINKLKQEFNLVVPDGYVNDPRRLSYKKMYSQLYIFKVRAPQRFASFQREFIETGIYFPPLYLSRIRESETENYANNVVLRKFYLDFSAALNNIELFNCLSEQNIQADYITLEFAAYTANATIINHLLTLDLPTVDSSYMVKMPDDPYKKTLSCLAYHKNMQLFTTICLLSQGVGRDVLLNALKLGNKELIKLINGRELCKDEKFCYTTEDLLCSAIYSGNLDLVQEVLSWLELDKKNDWREGSISWTTEFVRIFVGFKGSKELIDWVTSLNEFKTRPIEFQLLFLVSIYRGIILRGNVSLAKAYCEKWALDLNNIVFDRKDFFKAALESNNPKMVIWFLSQINDGLSDWHKIIPVDELLKFLLEYGSEQTFIWAYEALLNVNTPIESAYIIPTRQDILNSNQFENLALVKYLIDPKHGDERAIKSLAFINKNKGRVEKYDLMLKLMDEVEVFVFSQTNNIKKIFNN
jgi:hypothetical protein